MTAAAATPSAPPEVLATVRRAVRLAIEETPALRQDPGLERRIANKMVGISLAAADLLAEEKRMSERIAAQAPATAAALAADPEPEPMAVAQTASQLHGMSAVRATAGTLRATRDAIDFPGFVTSLITGVFQSVQTSGIQQLQAFSDLLEAVSGSLGDFAATQITDGRARSWAAGRFQQLTLQGEGDGARLVLKPDTEPPPAAEVARALDAKPGEVRSLDGGDIDGTLVPLVRRKLARDRQSMLSTMVLMGLQRVVVDDGFVQASMDLRVDARSTAERTQAEQLDTRVETEASGSFGMGAWGASAKLGASVGFVKSDEQFTREDIAVSAGLRSNVQVRFHTEPLDAHRVASDRTLDKLKDQAMVPTTEKSLIEGTRQTSQAKFPTPSTPGSLIGQNGGTVAEAGKARDSARLAQEKPAEKTAETPVETPVEKPAEPPTDKPAEPPTDKTADKVAEKTADKTADKHTGKPAKKPVAKGKALAAGYGGSAAPQATRSRRTPPAGTARAPIRKVTTWTRC